MFNFAEAMRQVLYGRRVTRMKWSGREYIASHLPDTKELLTEPFMYKGLLDHYEKTSWLPSQEDIFATDWYLFEENVALKSVPNSGTYSSGTYIKPLPNFDRERGKIVN